MPKQRRQSFLLPHEDFVRATSRKVIPHAFVLDALAAALPRTRSMFGCLAIYVNEKIVCALRDKPTHTNDNGMWLATSEEHHASLRRHFPNLRSIGVFGKPVTAWQVLPAEADDFEEAALGVCELILAGDGRIGTIPKPRKRQKTK